MGTRSHGRCMRGVWQSRPCLRISIIRGEATTVSGTHEVSDGGLWQCGPSKEDPSRLQIKVMMGSLDPLGMPLATDVLSGERADDGLYIPLIKRLEAGMSQTGL